MAESLALARTVLSISCQVTLPMPPKSLEPAATPADTLTARESASASAETELPARVASAMAAVKSLSTLATLTAAPAALPLEPATTKAAPTLRLPLLAS